MKGAPLKEHVKLKIKEANTMLGTGAGLAAFGAGSAALIGATCPLCIVAAPVLIGIGVVGRIKAARLQKETSGGKVSMTEKNNGHA